MPNEDKKTMIFWSIGTGYLKRHQYYDYPIIGATLLKDTMVMFSAKHNTPNGPTNRCFPSKVERIKF